MVYTVKQLAALSGVSARALRYYDQIGLLCPARLESGYRAYGEQEVDRLQQILFFRELGFSLSDISKALADKQFNRASVFSKHLEALEKERDRLDVLIKNIKKTMTQEKGGSSMSAEEKFMGFKRELIRENEEKYGDEIREKYGDNTVNASNAKLMNMSEANYAAMQGMAAQLNALLEDAVKESADPGGERGREAALLHKRWLTFTWPKYSRQAHVGLTQMYLADDRFKAYYDQNVAGCAQFLHDAVEAWQGEL